MVRKSSKLLDLEIVGKVYDELVVNCNSRHRILCGGRGKGASWSIARTLLAKGMQQPKFFPCVRQVQKTIKHSVKKLLADTIADVGLSFFYKVYDTEIRGANGTLFTFHGLQEFNADNIKSLEGADECWVAEAQCIARRSLGILRPTIRKNGSIIWYDFNPRYDTDPIWVDYIVNKDPYAKVLKLSWRDNPWFTEALKQEKEADYLRDKKEADHIWEGELRTMGEKFVCPSGLVDIAIKNNLFTSQGEIVVGADIAHQGGDEITFYYRQGNKVLKTYINKLMSTPEVVRELKAFAIDRSTIINIDNGHVGAAVADYLEEDGWIVNRINFGGSPKDKVHYADTATEMYFELRDMLNEIDIPNDDMLRSQLVQRRYEYINSSKGYEVVKLESKKEFATHCSTNIKSPDRADGLVLCFYDTKKSCGAETLNHNIY